jgi:crotonobetainyl-CoA:carnitine CoA-transferase CaiB-like acyl-CoA transferase
MPTLVDVRRMTVPILRGTMLGSALGILPGGGATLASFAAYAVEKQASKTPEEFGKGALEGVAAPEAANNAGAQTSFIPMLTLGIPANPVMALMIGAMVIHGIVPGPNVVPEQPALFWGVIASMWIGNLMLVILNLPLIGLWVKLLKVPYYVLFPVITGFCAIGVYSVNSNVYDLYTVTIFGLMGYVLIKVRCEPAPLLLGFVLGPLLEENLRRALLLSHGDPTVFITRPISAILLVIALVVLAAVLIPAPGAIDTVLRLVKQADGLLEGFRPGVMERLGLGPDVCLAANPRLVYGRITGFGQDGPLAQTVGHDINYLAFSGALHGIGRRDAPPSPPLNLLADMAGGGMYLAFGMVCALLEAARSQRGQVVDVSMVDSVVSLMSSVMGMRAAGLLHDRRGENYYDSGAPWYDSYETADGKYISVGAIEGRFHKSLVGLLGIDDGSLPAPHAQRGWPELRKRFAAAFRKRTRDEWVVLTAGKEVCVAPVLTPDEAARHPHMRARGTFVEIAGVEQPAPQPRFSRTRAEVSAAPSEPVQTPLRRSRRGASRAGDRFCAQRVVPEEQQGQAHV